MEEDVGEVVGESTGSEMIVLFLVVVLSVVEGLFVAVVIGSALVGDRRSDEACRTHCMRAMG